ARKQPFTFDYQFDAAGHPEQYYCRSDHYMYARYGIPIAFFTTGSHRDYHQVTDEPEYIDYDKLAHVAQFVYDVATTVANLDHRVVVDKPKPDPHGNCVQQPPAPNCTNGPPTRARSAFSGLTRPGRRRARGAEVIDGAVVMDGEMVEAPSDAA